MLDQPKSLLALVIASTLTLTACGGSSSNSSDSDSDSDSVEQTTDGNEGSGEDTTDGDSSSDDTADADSGSDDALGSFSTGVWAVQSHTTSAETGTSDTVFTQLYEVEGESKFITICGQARTELTETDTDDSDDTDSCDPEITQLGDNHWKASNCPAEGDYVVYKKLSSDTDFSDGTLTVVEEGIDSANACLFSSKTTGGSFDVESFAVSVYSPEQTSLMFSITNGSIEAKTYSGSEFSVVITSASLADQIGATGGFISVLPTGSTLTIDEITTTGFKGTYSLDLTTDFTTVATTITGSFDVNIDDISGE